LAPTQVPFWQVSVWVQALPSLQAVSLAFGGLEHCPVAGLHVPASWHWSEAVQTTEVPAVQTPFWQVSVWVQALPSLQDAPLVLFGLEHSPVAGSQVPAMWQASRAVQTFGVPAVQTPFWQVSLIVQGLPSLQAVPFDLLA
jgi:hypothetical protein